MILPLSGTDPLTSYDRELNNGRIRCLELV